LRKSIRHAIRISSIYIKVASLILFLFLSLSPDLLAAGGITTTDSVPAYKIDTVPGVPQLDAIDVLKLIFNFKKNPLRKPPKRGTLGPFYSIVAFPGYAIATGVAAVATANISFHLKKNPSGELCFINSQFQYTQGNQVIVQSLPNFYTPNEKWQFPGDIRFQHFPTTTYGLGSNTLPSAADDIDFYHFRFYRTVLRRVHHYTWLGLGYNLDYRWNVEDDNADRGFLQFPV
jgi:hypothetical protein